MTDVQVDKRITRTQGDDWDDIIFQYFQPDGTTPLDITDWTFKFAIYDGADQIVEVDGTVDLVTAKVTCPVLKEATIDIKRGEYQYYFQQTNASGKTKTRLNSEPFIVAKGRTLS